MKYSFLILLASVLIFSACSNNDAIESDITSLSSNIITTSEKNIASQITSTITTVNDIASLVIPNFTKKDVLTETSQDEKIEYIFIDDGTFTNLKGSAYIRVVDEKDSAIYKVLKEGDNIGGFVVNFASSQSPKFENNKCVFLESSVRLDGEMKVKGVIFKNFSSHYEEYEPLTNCELVFAPYAHLYKDTFPLSPTINNRIKNINFEGFSKTLDTDFFRVDISKDKYSYDEIFKGKEYAEVEVTITMLYLREGDIKVYFPASVIEISDVKVCDSEK